MMRRLEDLTYQSSPDEVAEAIIAELIRRGYTRDEAIGVISSLLQESGLRMVWSSNRLWFGYAQQDDSYPLRTDPAGNVRGFLDRLDAKRRSPQHGDIWENIFWLQQGPNWPSARHAMIVGRLGYLVEIKSKIVPATTLVDRFWGVAPPSTGEPMADNRPDFNEWPMWSPNNSDRRGAKIDLFLLHTQEGGGGDAAAENLAKYLQGNDVSYHYAIGQASDGGVTVVDVVDTDRAAWSVLSANPRSINLCFAGSHASWSRTEWLKQAKAIDVAAYLAVQDCKKYGIPITVIAPPYTTGLAGISDHQYVTKVLNDGTHTDVGPNFPWDVFESAVTKYASDKPTEPSPPMIKRFPEDWTDRELLIELLRQLRGPTLEGWLQLAHKSVVDFLDDMGKRVQAIETALDIEDPTP